MFPGGDAKEAAEVGRAEEGHCTLAFPFAASQLALIGASSTQLAETAVWEPVS